MNQAQSIMGDTLTRHELDILISLVSENKSEKQWIEYEFDPENPDDHCPSFRRHELEFHYDEFKELSDLESKLCFIQKHTY